MDALICGKRGLTLDELEGVLEKTATVLAGLHFAVQTRCPHELG